MKRKKKYDWINVTLTALIVTIISLVIIGINLGIIYWVTHLP
jgi:hypothetical protein